MRNKKIKNFRTPLHSICGNDDLRQALQYVYFENGFAYATDAYKIMKSALSLHDFTEEESRLMNGKFIHKSAFAKLFKYNHVTATETGFSCIKNDVKCDIYYSDFDGKYPNCENLLQNYIEKGSSEIKQIGINPKYLESLCKLFVKDIVAANKFIFTGENKGIIVLDHESSLEDHKQIGILMPAQIS